MFKYLVRPILFLGLAVAAQYATGQTEPYIDADGAQPVVARKLAVVVESKPLALEVDDRAVIGIAGPMQVMTGLEDFHEATWIHKYNGRYYLSYSDNHDDGCARMREIEVILTVLVSTVGGPHEAALGTSLPRWRRGHAGCRRREDAARVHR